MCNNHNCPKCGPGMIDRSKSHPWKGRRVTIGSPDRSLNRSIVEVGDWFDTKYGMSLTDFVMTKDDISHLPKDEQVMITTFGIRILMQRLPKSPHVVMGTFVYPENMAGKQFLFHNVELVAPVDPTPDDATAIDFESITPEKLAINRYIFEGITMADAFHKEHHPLCCKQYGPAKVLDWMERFSAFIAGGMPEPHYRKYVEAMKELSAKVDRGDVGFPADNDYVMVYFSDTDTIKAIHNSCIDVEMQLLV